MKKNTILFIIAASSLLLMSCSNPAEQPSGNIPSDSIKNSRNIKTFFFLSNDETKKAAWIKCVSNDNGTNNGITNNGADSNNNDAFTLEKAIEMAKAEYGEDDIEYHYDSDGVKERNGKKYYVIIPRSKSMRQAGGTGTLFTVRVFEDGTIEDVSDGNESFN